MQSARVPFHKFLLDDLRLLDYVSHLRSKGEQRLFPEINPDRDGYGGPVSKWFNERYKTKCGIKSVDRQKSFHSFRSTFISALEDKVQFRKLQQCAGHSRGKSTTITYIEKYSPKRLYDEVVSKLEYPGLDLTHLKKSRYVNT